MFFSKSLQNIELKTLRLQNEELKLLDGINEKIIAKMSGQIQALRDQLHFYVTDYNRERSAEIRRLWQSQSVADLMRLKNEKDLAYQICANLADNFLDAERVDPKRGILF